MKITDEKIKISQDTQFRWDEIKNLRALNDTLVITLKDEKVIECPHVHPVIMDEAFKTYEKFLMKHNP